MRVPDVTSSVAGGAAVHQAVVLDEALVARTRPRGSMLVVCPVPGCGTLTMGGTCVAHDPPVAIKFARGRPYMPKTAATFGTGATRA
jgi:hypothetical protein